MVASDSMQRIEEAEAARNNLEANCVVTRPACAHWMCAGSNISTPQDTQMPAAATAYDSDEDWDKGGNKGKGKKSKPKGGGRKGKASAAAAAAAPAPSGKGSAKSSKKVFLPLLPCCPASSHTRHPRAVQSGTDGITQPNPAIIPDTIT